MAKAKERIGITGVAGRMGRVLVEAVNNDQQVTLSAATHRPGSSVIGDDAGTLVGLGELSVQIEDSLAKTEFDTLIDFTLVGPSLKHLEYCCEYEKKLVLGTTGFNPSQREQITQAAEQTAIVMAPNMSVGVNLCFHLLQQAAQVIGADSDIEILETHHRHKLDAPSGTALKMGEVIADTLSRDLDRCAVYGREGISEPRDTNTIGFASLRAGDVVGDHTVLFASEGERVEISHKASNRMTFAKGAIRAAKWLANKPNGLYDMQDVLGLK